MALTNKPQQPPKRATASGQRTNLQRAVRETATDMVKDSIFQKRPYLKYALTNPYNLSLFFGTMAAAVATANPILAAMAIGGEALWLLHGSESKTLRRLLWDPRFTKIRLALEEREREERIKTLPGAEQERVRELVSRHREIDRLAEDNPSFTGDLLRTELVKTRKLVDSFIEMSLNVNRYAEYLENVDLDDVEKERQQWQARASLTRATEREREIAGKNLAVIMKRIEKLHEIRNYLGVARAQLDLIENSFQLISDQIVTMQSPAELSGQLDDLLDGVDSIQQTAIDTEKILGALEA